MSFCGKMLIGILCGLLGTQAAWAADAVKVPSPWTPVNVTSRPAGADVSVWGRTYRFDHSPLPASITSAGQNVLASPVRLAGLVGGERIQWPRSGMMVMARGQDRATLSGWLANDSVIVDVTVRAEFDGLLRLDFVVVPQRGATPRLDQLWLEVPMKASCASLFHFWPGRWGRAENSGSLTEQGLRLPFKPLVWLGWEDGGLSWFAESDQAWRVAKGGPAIEVIPQGGQTLLRIHLLDSAPTRLPITFTCGLQATPVKPVPKDFHEWRIWHAPQLATTLAKSASVVFPKWFTCHRAFPDGKPLPALDRAAQLGVKTVVFHEDWAPIQNYPATSEEPELKRLIDACHQRGMKVLLYFGYEIASLAPEWAEMSDQVLVKDSKGFSHAGWHRLPEQRDFRVCYHSRWQDVLVEGIARLMDRTGFDGVYLDGTSEPVPCCNQAHGCGYTTADGALHPTYPIFAVRRLMQRLYALTRPRGGLVNVHQSTCCLTPTLGFADSYWDGEQFSGGELAGDPLAKLPLGAFRAEFMGKNFGIPCEFLAYERPPKWTFDDALAFTMLHDVRVRPHGSGRLLEQMSKIWQAMTRFDAGRAEWHPYWKNAEWVSTQPETVKVSLYSHPGRALLVVSNLAGAEAKTAQVKIDFARLGLPATAKAKDALGGEKMELADGRLVLPLAPMRMRLVWVE